jgi:hypothetical protein
MKKTLFILTFFISGLSLGVASEMQNLEEATIAANYQNEKTNNYHGSKKVQEISNEYFIQGSFIYWQPIEKDLELGEYVPTAPYVNSYEEINMDFDFKPGFKIALGYVSNENNWDLVGEYTWLHCTNSKSVNAPSWGYVNDYWSTSANATYMKLSWKLDYDMATADFGRSYLINNKLCLKPFVGLKGGVIDQKLSDRALDAGNVPGYIDATYKSDSWLIGPRLGINMNWLIGQGFSFVSNGSMNFLYQSFKVKVASQDATDATHQTIRNKQDVYYITPNFDFTVGFNWKTKYGATEQYSFEIATLYDFLHYFNQNKTKRAQTIVYGSDIGNLMLHGLTIDLKFGF